MKKNRKGKAPGREFDDQSSDPTRGDQGWVSGGGASHHLSSLFSLFLLALDFGAGGTPLIFFWLHATLREFNECWGSNKVRFRSIEHATQSNRSDTERRARAYEWPRARLIGSRWTATRAQ